MVKDRASITVVIKYKVISELSIGIFTLFLPRLILKVSECRMGLLSLEWAVYITTVNIPQTVTDRATYN